MLKSFQSNFLGPSVFGWYPDGTHNFISLIYTNTKINKRKKEKFTAYIKTCKARNEQIKDEEKASEILLALRAVLLRSGAIGAMNSTQLVIRLAGCSCTRNLRFSCQRGSNFVKNNLLHFFPLIIIFVPSKLISYKK